MTPDRTLEKLAEGVRLARDVLAEEDLGERSQTPYLAFIAHCNPEFVLEVAREVERLRKRVAKFEDERKIGDTPHRCLNPDCGTISYGAGYDSCPRCGGTEGRAALANPAAEAGE